MKCYIFTHSKASYNTNLAKDYILTVHTEKADAVQALKKQFNKTLQKTCLAPKIKEEIEQKFKENLLHGKFNYHFRDTADPEEPQYFGKIHTREVNTNEI